MNVLLLFLVLAAAAWLAVGHLPGPGRRMAWLMAGKGQPGERRRRRRKEEHLPLAVLVQQLAALLRGGRSTARLWEEAWMVHGGKTASGGGVRLSDGSIAVLAAARSASLLGASAAGAIRAASGALSARPREQRIWGELADCLDIAESSGCPLADILGRFAAHLEAEDDAEAARQTALAGPKATVRLLNWLPLFGLGLGTVLGVDPLGILIGNPFGVAALAAGIVLTVVGRFWSLRLVRAAMGAA
jgi:tight adherence protein B